MLNIRREQFDAYVDKLTVAEGGHHESESGHHLCNFRYSGQIYIERLPAGQLPLLALYVRAWLDEHDDTRGDYQLPDPTLEIIPLDDDKYIDVLLPVEFCDPVHLAPAAADDPEALDWNGGKYRVAGISYDIAEAGIVHGAPTGAE